MLDHAALYSEAVSLFPIVVVIRVIYSVEIGMLAVLFGYLKVVAALSSSSQYSSLGRALADLEVS
jgi:hypothetical protein